MNIHCIEFFFHKLLQIPYFQTITPLTFDGLGQYLIGDSMVKVFNANFRMEWLTSRSDRDLLIELE